MKKWTYLITGIMLLMSLSAYSAKKPARTRFDYTSFIGAACINGYWGEWQRSYWNKINFYGNHFVIYNNINSNHHPSKYFMRVSWTDSTERIEDGWYRYDGNVEYYVYNATDRFYFDRWPSWEANAFNGGQGFKKTSPATVLFQGNVINVFFESNGIAIQGEYR